MVRQTHNGVAGAPILARAATRDPVWMRWGLTGVAVAFLLLMLILPLVVVLTTAFSKGWSGFAAVFAESDSFSAIKLTLLAAVISVPINIVFGVAAAWATLRVRLRDAGRRMPVNDSWIAASAIALGVPVITQDDDYDYAPGVEVIKV